MTSAQWARMSPEQRDSATNKSYMKHPLFQFLGDRVEVVTTYGETRRFWVGKSTGWVPCLLEVHNARSMGGGPVESTYESILLVREGPRR